MHMWKRVFFLENNLAFLWVCEHCTVCLIIIIIINKARV